MSIEQEDHATIEAIARKVTKEVLLQGGFKVEPEMHYGQHKEMSEIDSTLENRHLDQHKWMDKVIQLFRRTALGLGSAILYMIAAAVGGFLLWWYGKGAAP